MSKTEVSLHIYRADTSTHTPLPFADQGIQAGFPSPAQDYLTETIDLNHEIVRHPASTFYGRVDGDSMIDEGIEPGDILAMLKLLTGLFRKFTVRKKERKCTPDRAAVWSWR